MNGDISVDSEKNVGTTFRIKLTLDGSKQKTGAENSSKNGTATEKTADEISGEDGWTEGRRQG